MSRSWTFAGKKLAWVTDTKWEPVRATSLPMAAANFYGKRDGR